MTADHPGQVVAFRTEAFPALHVLATTALGVASDVDCAGASGNGPALPWRGEAQLLGNARQTR